MAAFIAITAINIDASYRYKAFNVIMEILHLRPWHISYLIVIYAYRIGKFAFKVILIYRYF